MPPRKKAKHSAPAAAPSRRSERSTRGVGGHVAQLKKTGETLAAPARKGRKEPIVQMSDSDAEENPMALSQLQRTKKNCSVTADNQVRSGSQLSRTPHPGLPTNQPLGRFGFKLPMSDICKALYSSGTTYGRQAADENVIEDRDFEGDRDSDLEHDRDLGLECNNRDDSEGSTSENDNQGPDDNLMEHEDNQMDRDQFPRQQEDQADHFDDGLEGGMQADFDQGIDDEPDNAARQKSQEGLLVGAQDLHQLIDMNINHLCALLPLAYSLLVVLHLGQASPQIAYSPSPGHTLCHGDPAKLGFYPPSWQALLQAAKVEMHLQAVLTHPVPEHGDALQLAQEVLDAELWRYHEKKIKMDKGYFPKYKAQMSRVLCDDLFTFRTELKKVIIPIAKSAYDIFPKGTVTRKEDIQKHIITAATKLLKTGGYLRIPDSSNGKWKNFVSQVLMDGCLAFYYSNSKKALKNTDKFHRTIPPNALILVAAVMKVVISGFSETGTDKVPDLSADRCRNDFNLLQKSLDKLMDIPERRDELEDMLAQWAGIGMGELVHGDSSAGGSDLEDVNIIL
ncbi:uncharacterized protein F5147DRAFT_766966 [Suillus discolor]|uniref:DUF6532 domain-containing protein n=1 Tax=Suillus discolor TaxID=1912936 RepID=A0A9P7FKN1_9AGAM|nr:uncharacterized protein F5147DRAFT_766966 [Suillus discolor]KAG2119476.1 hypothetical protein F5147DRAFT_766966 [Suillus discolor]